ncbi:kinase-like protein [Neofusicoccum parvum]|nr:kinase-like protein [Neofusicoccum parvum]
MAKSTLKLLLPPIFISSQIALASAVPWQCAPGAYSLHNFYPNVTHGTPDPEKANIGEGSSGRVFVDLSASPRAIKHFIPESSERELALQEQSIYHEYWLGHAMDHPNIARSHELWHEDDEWYMSMELIPFSLLDLLDYDAYNDEPWSFLSMSCLFWQMLNAVAHVHSLGVAHRDLKVENFMVSHDGTVKLIDFGSASVFRDPVTGHHVHHMENRVGTLITMPPEAESEEFIDLEAADVWALGVMFVRLWLGVYPWQEATLEDAAFAEYVRELNEETGACDSSMEDDDVSGDTLICSLPDSVRPVVGGMLALDPEKRMAIDTIFTSAWMQSVRNEVDDFGR